MNVEWTDEDIRVLIAVCNIDIGNPKTLYESALANGDIDQAYRICYTLCDHYWNKIEIDKRFEF